MLIDTNESNNNNNFGFTSNSGSKSRNSSLINNTTSTSFKGISPRSGINITNQPTSPEMISYQNTSYSIKHNNIDNNPNENIDENVHSDGNINNCDKEIPIYSMENNHINNIKKSLSNFETKTRKSNSDITATGMNWYFFITIIYISITMSIFINIFIRIIINIIMFYAI